MPSDRTSTQSMLPSLSQQNIARARQAPSSWRSEAVDVFDAAKDLQWAQWAKETKAPHTYYDYYFTGQDMQVYIDGTEDHPLDITEFMFTIEQQKTPVYGFWSHTYDAVMKGTRLVSGAMHCPTKSTDYVKNHIAFAAKQRAEQNATYPIRGLDVDQQNIEQYWSQTVDPSTSTSRGQHLFSSHPPFNFVCVYGVQSTSITNNPSARMEQVFQRYQDDTALMTNINERLVESDPVANTMRWVMEAVELTSCQVSYTSDGAVAGETYQFFARDVYYP